jgi:hypothetical protein
MLSLERIAPHSSHSSFSASSNSDDDGSFYAFKEVILRKYFPALVLQRTGDPLIRLTEDEIDQFEFYIKNAFQPEEWTDFLGIIINHFDTVPLFRMLVLHNRHYLLQNARRAPQGVQARINAAFAAFPIAYVLRLGERAPHAVLNEEEKCLIRRGADALPLSAWLSHVTRIERCQRIAFEVFECLTFIKISDFLTQKESLAPIMEWIERRPRHLGSEYALAFIKHMFDWNYKVTFFFLVRDPEMKNRAIEEMAKCIIFSGSSQLKRDHKELLKAVKRIEKEDLARIKTVLKRRLSGEDQWITYANLKKALPLKSSK